MADDLHIDNQNADNQDQSKAPNQDGGEGEGKQSTWQELAGVDPNEFDSPEKLAKSYKDARKGLSDQGQKIKQAEEFQNNVTPVLKAVYGNPDLYKKVVEEVKKLYGEDAGGDSSGDTNTVTPQKDPRVDEIAGIEEARIISEFEASINLTGKSEDEKAKIRREIGNNMKNWLTPGSAPSLQQLPRMLKDAWSVYKQENNITEDKIEPQVNLSLGFGTPRAAQAVIEKLDTSSLSPEEKVAAQRMGLSLDEYLQSKKEILSR